ncbi:MAG: hypothetical protein ABJ013_04195 [Halioglobus sp.]
MDSLNIAIGVIWFGVIVWGLWQLLGGPMTQPDVDYQLKRFASLLATLESPEDEYQFFEKSHLIWAESDQGSIRKQIKISAGMQPGINKPISHRPRFYHFRVNEEDKRIYFAISDQSQFEWDSVPHYSDYVGSQNPVER